MWLRVFRSAIITVALGLFFLGVVLIELQRATARVDWQLSESVHGGDPIVPPPYAVSEDVDQEKPADYEKEEQGGQREEDELHSAVLALTSNTTVIGFNDSFQHESSSETFAESELFGAVDISRKYDETTFTIFTAPKPTTSPHIAMIQRNALMSWNALRPKPHILIFGNESGLDELARSVGARHIPRIKMLDRWSRGVHSSRNITAAPALASLFYQAMAIATTKTLVFINADILLPPLFSEILMTANNATDAFLLMSHRYRLWVREPLDFDNPSWYMEVFGKCDVKGHKSQGPSCTWQRDTSRAVDYFGFTRLTWHKVKLLEFAVGRPAYDNWLVYKAAASGTPVISATEVLRVVHQNHDYSHITSKPKDEKLITGKNWELFENPLAEYNRRIIAFKSKEGIKVVKGDQRFNTFKMRKESSHCAATKYLSYGCRYQVVRVRPHPRLIQYLPKERWKPEFKCKQKRLCLLNALLPTGT
eukprot:TRINITY_DN80539_c0_g1_i1.p1 TRINITY_DN80539_c0_g1~~TRINITY_DN80539_c0_g1_i1.p1  ORF type:complete len:478 (+),score=59.45 TRINITY_DN80539_c0_g1_i1:93-1526(+)